MQPWSKPAHAVPSEQVLQHLQSDRSTGITDAEAELRRREVGLNRLAAAPPRSLALRFLQQFDNPLQLMLLLAGGAKALLGDLGHDPTDLDRIRNPRRSMLMWKRPR